MGYIRNRKSWIFLIILFPAYLASSSLTVPHSLLLHELMDSSNDLFTSLSIIEQNCFVNSKIESMTGKKRSLLSPVVVKAWKLGNLNLTFKKSCQMVKNFKSDDKTRKAQLRRLINNMKEWSRFQWSSSLSDKKQLNHQILLALQNAEASDSRREQMASTQGLGSSHNSQRDHDPFFEIAQRMNYAKRCQSKFVSHSGYGPLARVIKETLSRGMGREVVNYDTSFGGACPGYRGMNAEQRKNVWVFVMMSMSHYESSCKEKVSNQGPYGLASGLLQLHEDNEDIYAHWDPDLNCDKGASMSAKKSVKCALTMIGNQIYKGVPFFNENSHWQVLRKVDKPGSQAYQIRYAISQIPECKANPLYFDFALNPPIPSKKEVYRSKPHSVHELALLH